MDILISNARGEPIYQQIADRIRDGIISGELEEGEALPSMRALARELRISVITTKRAYEDLEREGFILSYPGKGSFVAPKNVELIREQKLMRIEELLQEAAREGAGCGLESDELLEMIELIIRRD